MPLKFQKVVRLVSSTANILGHAAIQIHRNKIRNEVRRFIS